MNLDPSLIREVLDALPDGDTKVRLTDAVLATMTPAQRWVMERWRSHVCEMCGHTMIAKVPAKIDKTNRRGGR